VRGKNANNSVNSSLANYVVSASGDTVITVKFQYKINVTSSRRAEWDEFGAKATNTDSIWTSSDWNLSYTHYLLRATVSYTDQSDIIIKEDMLDILEDDALP
jgi:hypothetical protein